MSEEKTLMDECIADSIELTEKNRLRVSADKIAEMAIALFKARKWKKIAK